VEGIDGIDLDKALYADLLKSKGFTNIQEAREYVRGEKIE